MSTEPIATLGSLLENIRGPLTILAGSGVSLRGHIAPGVKEFTFAILESLADRAMLADQANDYATHRIGRLVKRLLSTGKATQIDSFQSPIPEFKSDSLIARALQTKFEEVLRLCIDAGVDILPALKAAYMGLPDEHNENHSALAYLANNCGINILTTNFDLGIENAGLKTSLVPINGKWKDRTVPANPVLAKLHGCAERGGFVATSGTLLTLRGSREYEFLIDWCRGGTLLLVGYSGSGDVDISIHIWQMALLSTTKILWADYKDDPQIPFDATLVRCHLDRTDSKNMLLELAKHYGWKPSSNLSEAGWSRRVVADKLTSVSPFVAGRCLVEILGRCDKTVFLLDYLAASRGLNSPDVCQTFFDWWIERRADPPPLRTGHNLECQRFLRRVAHIPNTASYIRAWKAFAEWRSGRQLVALKEVASLVSMDLRLEHAEVRQRIYEFFLAIVAECLWADADRKQPVAILKQFSSELTKALDGIRIGNGAGGQRLESYFTGLLRSHEVQFWISVSSSAGGNCPAVAIEQIEQLVDLRNQARDLMLSATEIAFDHSLFGIIDFCKRRFQSEGSRPGHSGAPIRMSRIFEYKKRFAYRFRFAFLGGICFRFLEVRLLWLWEVFTRRPLFVWYSMRIAVAYYIAKLRRDHLKSSPESEVAK